MDKQFIAETYGLFPHLKGEEERLGFFLRWNAGLVIAGLKPASLIRLPSYLLETWEKFGLDMCISLDLEAMGMRGTNLFLIFRRCMLKKKIETGISSRYLSSLGYPSSLGLDPCLKFLENRFKNPRAFPHEVGIFLGYPLEDVISFSTGKPSPYDCRGYWKVYHHPERAKRTFAYMDAARVQIMKAFLAGGKVRFR